MEEYSQFKKKIQHRAEILEETIQEIERAGQTDEPASGGWRECLGGVHESMRDPLLKIAVAGSVKSGKSTLINAMIGEDLLKRGAGIVTAFITRIVTGESPGGWVELKAWPQVIAEINDSLRMLPVAAEEGSVEETLDIRRGEDRERIERRLDRMKSEWLQSRGNIDVHFLFLERCLHGFSLIRDEIGEDAGLTAFEKASLAGHQLYVGDESRSVYVRDIELHYPVPWLGNRMEIADCQGSDSPNPAHFALLQQYLLSSHFIIYVISSRTGLREADFKLLDLIKTLRMFPQTLFVLNLDYDIHDDKDDIERITERVRSELGWVVPEPRLFAFSALYHLLRQLGDKSSKFERRRLKLWKESKALSKTTSTGFAAFKTELESRICAQRSQVLLGSGLSRLGMVASSILDSMRLRQSMLESNLERIRDTGEKLRARHIALQSSLQNMGDTVSGLNQSLRRDLIARVDAWFDSVHGPIVREALEMVSYFALDMENRRNISDYARLIREYYAFYLEFRKNISRYLIDKINVRIMEFAKNEEDLIREQLQESSEALWAFFEAALTDYRRGLPGSDGASQPRKFAFAPGNTERLVPPSFSSFFERNGLGRGILFLKFGVSSLGTILSGIRAKMRRSIPGFSGAHSNPEEDLFAQAQDLARSEARSELLRAFAAFRENLKTAYLFRIVDDGCISLLREFKTRASLAQVDFANLLRQSELGAEERSRAMEAVTHARQMTSAMLAELDDIRQAVQEGIADREEAATPVERALPR